MQVRVLENITKEYPNMIQVLVYKKPRVFVSSEGSVKRHRTQVEDDYEPSVTSINRTKTLVKDITLCNDFDLFCTFTFDPDKVNRYSLTDCWGKMSRWIHHQRDLSPDMKYLIIPEHHKNGAWHFHALLSGFKGSMRDSHHTSATGRPVYNITSYRSGFSTAVHIYDREAVAYYVTKYITKDFVKTFNQRRFFCSRNLKRPIKTTNSPIFELTLPLFRNKVGDFGETELYNITPLLGGYGG